MKHERNSVSAAIWFVTNSIVIGAIGILAGCSTAVNLKWAEEVQMADGTILLVSRTAKGEMTGGNGMGGYSGWNQTEMTLDIKKTVTGTLLPPPPLWREPYVPILLDYQSADNIWSVVATFYYCDGWYQLGKPKLPYAEWQSRDGQPWQKVELEQRLIGRKTNLLAGPDAKGESRLVTVQERNERNRSDGKSYRWIIDEWKTNYCIGMGYYERNGK